MNQYSLQNISATGEGTSIVDFKQTDNDTATSRASITNTDTHAMKELPLSDDEQQELEDRIQNHICAKCSKSFRQFNEFKKHMVLCQFDSDYHLRKAEMMKNIEKIEKDAINLENKDICFCCEESYDTYHLGEINCADCAKSFKTQMSYKRHIFITHSESDEFPCSICNAKLRTSNLLKMHEEQHKNRACKICSKDFERKFDLKCHQKYTNCSPNTSDASSYEVSKTKTEEYMCPICKKCFTSLSIWKKHERIHKEEVPFACDFCEKKFKVLSLLMKHRRSHNGEEAYTRDECKKDFSTKESLRRHMNVHANETSYTCDKVSFSEAARLRFHTKNHIYPFACDQCGEKFKTNKELELHNKTHLSNGNYENEKRCDGTHTIEKELKIQHDVGDYTQHTEQTSNPIPDDNTVQPFIKDERSKTITKQLFENEVCSTVENETIRMEPKTSISENLCGANINNRTLIQDDTAVRQLIENEGTETTTEQLLLNNEVYTIITLENESIKMEQKTIVPESVVATTTEDQKSVAGEFVLQQFVEDKLSEITTEQLVEKKLCSAITEEPRDIKIESKTTVPESLVNVITQFIKDEPLEISTEQLLKNEEYPVTLLENPESIVSTIIDDRMSVIDGVAVKQSIKFEATETNTAGLLPENELFSVITLENESIKMEPNTTILESLAEIVTCDSATVEDGIYTKDELTETNTNHINEFSCSLKEGEEQHKSGEKAYVSKISKKRKNTHEGEGPFTCDFCEKKFPVFSVLENHRRSHTGEKPYTCTECKQCFAHKQALNHHMTRHTGEKPYACTKCNKSFAVKESLKRHLKIHTGEKPYACSECNQCFAIKEALNLHMRRHTGEKPFTCTECNQSFSRKQALNAHMMRHTGERPYMCPECKHCFARKQGLELHMKRHSGEKPFICTECNQCFAIKESLNRHMKLHTGEKPFTCIECNRSFAFKLALKRHMRRHTGEKPHACTECNKSFGVKQELKRHMRQHTGEKPYKCTECDQSFNIKDSLNRHMNRHTGQKPHTCAECNKSFAVKESLNRHMKLHTGEKPYSCNECNNSFAVKQALKRHMRQHTGEKPYKCTECNESFNVNDSLKRHMKRHAEEFLRMQQMQSKFFSHEFTQSSYETMQES